MKQALAVLLLSLGTAASTLAGDRNPVIRVFVRTGGGDAVGAADSTTDVQEALRQQKPDSVLGIAAASEAADLALWITRRYSTRKTDRGVSPAEQTLLYVVEGQVIDGRRTRLVRGASVIPREAAADLVGRVTDYAREEQHVLLRRRADWPDVGFEFEELTDEHKKQFGATAGAVVVTAVRPEGAARNAGLQVGDAILSLGDKKLKNAADLARAIYAGAAGASLRLEVAQRGARRPATLAIP